MLYNECVTFFVNRNNVKTHCHFKIIGDDVLIYGGHRRKRISGGLRFRNRDGAEGLPI